jgi:predicted ATPase
MIVAGEAGIGKTRLIDEFLDRVRLSGGHALHGACLDLAGDGMPYAPLTEALRRYFHELPGERATELVDRARSSWDGCFPASAESESPLRTAVTTAAGVSR